MATFRGTNHNDDRDTGFDTLFGRGGDDLLGSDQSGHISIYGGAGWDYLFVAVDPTALLQALERGIERPLIHVEDAARELLNARADSPAVHRLEGERLEDEKVERAPKDVGLFGCGHGLFCRVPTEGSIAPVGMQQESRVGGTESELSNGTAADSANEADVAETTGRRL